MALLTASAPATSSNMRGVHAWAWVTLAFFVLVVLEGAVVRVTSSGAGCGDRWPLCNGEVLPHHPRVATVIEFAHRSLTGISSAMFGLLIVWTFRVMPKRHLARLASLITGLLLLTEGALGAVLVLGHYVEKNASAMRVLVQGIHFSNTMLLLAAATATAVLLGRVRDVPSQGALRVPVLLTLFLTLLTGATGSIAALADTLFPSPTLSAAIAADFAASSPLLIRMRWIHPASAVLVVICTLWFTAVLARSGRQKLALVMVVNLVVQLLIGAADVLTLAPITLQVLHLFSADVFWITLVAVAVPVLLDRTSTSRLAADTRKGAKTLGALSI